VSDAGAVGAPEAASGRVVANVESALRAARWTLAAVASMVLIAYRPLSGTGSWITIGVAPAAVGAVALLNRIAPRDHRRWRRVVISQTLDVVGSLALVVALDAPLGYQAWVMLVLPVVAAAVRIGAAAAVLSWAAAAAGYTSLTAANHVDAPTAIAFHVQVAGMLLVIAAVVSIVARWMREGWEIQNELTAAADAREQRLAVIEAAGHQLSGGTPDDTLTTCLNHVIGLGYEAASLREPNAAALLSAAGRSELLSETWSGEQIRPGELVSTRWLHPDGRVTYSTSTVEPIMNRVVTGWSSDEIDDDLADALATLVARASDAIETATLLARLRFDADHDPLTGLANRGTFERYLRRCTDHHDNIALAFVDVDDFKHINDTHGHAVGDAILIEVAERLHTVIDERGLAARIGGDEFVIVQPDAEPADAIEIARATVTLMRYPILVHSQSFEVRLSVGVASALTSEAPAAILATADAALYRAKASGKNTFVHLDHLPATHWPAPSSSPPGPSNVVATMG
jgi:diguanylate cyclase (GGDEF)-like protein